MYHIQKSRCKPKVAHRDRLNKYNGKDVHSWLVDNGTDAHPDELDTTTLPIPNASSVLAEDDGENEPDTLEIVESNEEGESDDERGFENAEVTEVSDGAESLENSGIMKTRSEPLSDYRTVEEPMNEPIMTRSKRQVKPPNRYGEWTK